MDKTKIISTGAFFDFRVHDVHPTADFRERCSEGRLSALDVEYCNQDMRYGILTNLTI